MDKGNAFWKVFEATGHIGAYLLYKDYSIAGDKKDFGTQSEGTNAATGGEV